MIDVYENFINFVLNFLVSYVNKIHYESIRIIISYMIPCMNLNLSLIVYRKYVLK